MEYAYLLCMGHENHEMNVCCGGTREDGKIVSRIPKENGRKQKLMNVL